MNRTIYNEESAVYLDVAFLSTEGNQFVPNDITLTVHDSDSGQLMQNTPIAPSATLTAIISAQANVINDPNKAIENRTATFTVNQGLSTEHNEVYKYGLRNFAFV
ncbi:MAG: hypothetical protein AAF578_00365 [Pseudomonadota bacterium]